MADSESFTNLFHKYGVNMRYLGYVLKKLKEISEEKKIVLKHIEFILEKEIFVRCLKHKFTEFLS